MGVPIPKVIEMKRERLKEEMHEEEPNKKIEQRLKDSIRRHKKEMIEIKRIQRRKKR